MPTINLQFRDEITFDQLTDALKLLVKERGCPACGLNGFDLQLGLDPAIQLREKFQKLPWVQLDVLRPLHELPALGRTGLG